MGTSIHGGVTGKPGRGLICWGFTCGRRFWKRVSVSIEAPLGILGRRSFYRELREKVEGGLPKWSISIYGSFVRGTWRHKRRLWRWAPLSIGDPLGKLEGRFLYQGL
jgi:hypothetical protein